MRCSPREGRLVHVTRLIAFGSALLAAAACSGSDRSSTDTESSGSGVTTTIAAAMSPASADTVATSPATLAPDPLSALLDRVSADPATAELQRTRVEELTAQCMHDRGWEYWVGQSDPNDPGMNPRPNDDIGYGVVESYETYTLSELQGAPPPTMPIDKNIEYVQSLSPEDAARYNKDNGGDTTPDDPDSATAYEQSCSYTAQAQAGTLPAFELIDGLEDRIRDLLTMVDSDPAVTAALDTFDACVDDSFGPREILGHSVAADPYLYVLLLRNQAMGLELIEDAGTASDAYSTSRLPGGAEVSSVGTPRPIADTVLEQLRDTELRLYRANTDCNVSSGVDEARNAVKADIAEQLLREFPDLAVAAGG